MIIEGIEQVNVGDVGSYQKRVRVRVYLKGFKCSVYVCKAAKLYLEYPNRSGIVNGSTIGAESVVA